MDPGTPARFARYAERVVRALADRVDWYCTINEPGIVAWGGCLGALDFPPGRMVEPKRKGPRPSWSRALPLARSAAMTPVQGRLMVTYFLELT